jgi:hypothetical protein
VNVNTSFTTGWNHVVLVLQESSPPETPSYAAFYVNGAFHSEDTSNPIADLETTNPVRMGETGLAGADAQLDDVRIYTRLLSASDVTTLYNE